MTWLPSTGLSNVAWQCEAIVPLPFPGPDLCPQPQGSGDIDFSLNLPPYASLLFTVDAELTPAAGSGILIEAGIAPGHEYDPDPTNNQIQRSLPIIGIHRDGFE